jgi:hypothetical protein
MTSGSATVIGGLRREAIRQSAGVTLPIFRPPGRNPAMFQSLRYYNLPGQNPDVAAEPSRSSLAAGRYLFLWGQQTGPNPLSLRQGYVVTIRRSDGHTIGEWQTPAEVEPRWRTAGIPFPSPPKISSIP